MGNGDTFNLEEQCSLLLYIFITTGNRMIISVSTDFFLENEVLIFIMLHSVHFTNLLLRSLMGGVHFALKLIGSIHGGHFAPGSIWYTRRQRLSLSSASH